MKVLMVLVFLLMSFDMPGSVIEVRTWIKPSLQPEIRNDQFILVDFWATWCGPCIRAMDHLHELKKVTDDRVVYISLSKEPEQIVENFLKKREAKTFIAIDNDGKTFDKFSVKALPHAILIAPDGQIIWSGNPSEMSFSRMVAIIKPHYSGIDIDKKIKTVESKVKTQKDNNLYFDLFRYEFTDTADETPFNASLTSGTLNISGSVAEMVSYVYDVPIRFVETENIKKPYGFLTIYDYDSGEQSKTLKYLLSHIYGIEVWEHSREIEVYKVGVYDKSLLWSAEIYDWDSEGKPSFMYWENNLQADNYSLQSIASLLTHHTDHTFVFDQDYDEVHDWNLDLRDIEALNNQLYYEYGIELIAENRLAKMLQIKKK